MEVSTFMQEINNTQYFKVQKEQEIEVKDVIARIYEALKEKGYNPVNQIVGYVMSGDPTYITSYLVYRIVSFFFKGFIYSCNYIF